MKETIIFILLFAYQSNYCDKPGCLVMHYPISAHIKVCKTIEEVNKQNLSSDTQIYQYDFATNKLTILEIEPILKKIETDTIEGYRIKQCK